MGSIEDRDRLPSVSRRSDQVDLGGGRRLQRAIDELAADGRLEEAVQERSRRHWLDRQLDEDSSLTGVLLDLAEHDARLVIHTVGGHQLVGCLVTVARDFCAVELEPGHTTLVRIHAIEAVRQVEGAHVRGVDRGPRSGQDFETAVATLTEHRPEVTVTTARGTRLAGRVLTVGRDVVRLELEGGGGVVFIPLAAVWEIGLA